MTPKQQYAELVAKNQIRFDASQQAALDEIERIYGQLSGKFSWRRWLGLSIKGLYLWGPVGVGKTLLMDLLYKTIPVKKKRMHFYLFMQYIHEQLSVFQGQKNPLQKIAKKISRECELILFDEFYVKNIADAMILGNLLKALFKYKVCFVATSNTEPAKLYWEGLQREQFIPAILQIEKHCEILELKAEQDYRLHHLIDSQIYFCPENKAALEQLFRNLTATHQVSHEPLTINDRLIEIQKRSSDVLWINFNDLCNIPRSSADYALLIKKYSPIIISGIPKISPTDYARISNFIQFIDIAYDNKIHCVFSADVEINELYTEGKYLQDFQRTQSRIHEMQSKDYVCGE